MKRSRKQIASSEATWSEWVAEARTLLEVSPEEMTPEQGDRLDAISDALIHLAGYAESLEREVSSERDPSVLKILRHCRAPSHGGLSNVERVAVRERILTGLQAAQLRVREAQVPPYEQAMESPRVASTELMRELEVLRRAVVVPGLSIAAGAGLELWDVECCTTVDVPEDVPRGRHVALRVSGDSMEPLIHSGDLVPVRLDTRPLPETVVVARDPDHGYVIKEVGRLTAGGIELRSLNPAYPVLRVPHGVGTVLGTVVLCWPCRDKLRN
jgi:SOS-response transcriptional repressor LexA